jgi:hypothetical protein
MTEISHALYHCAARGGYTTAPDLRQPRTLTLSVCCARRVAYVAVGLLRVLERPPRMTASSGYYCLFGQPLCLLRLNPTAASPAGSALPNSNFGYDHAAISQLRYCTIP